MLANEVGGNLGCGISEQLGKANSEYAAGQINSSCYYTERRKRTANFGDHCLKQRSRSFSSKPTTNGEETNETNTLACVSRMVANVNYIWLQWECAGKDIVAYVHFSNMTNVNKSYEIACKNISVENLNCILLWRGCFNEKSKNHYDNRNSKENCEVCIHPCLTDRENFFKRDTIRPNLNRHYELPQNNQQPPFFTNSNHCNAPSHPETNDRNVQTRDNGDINNNDNNNYNYDDDYDNTNNNNGTDDNTNTNNNDNNEHANNDRDDENSPNHNNEDSNNSNDNNDNNDNDDKDNEKKNDDNNQEEENEEEEDEDNSDDEDAAGINGFGTTVKIDCQENTIKTYLVNKLGENEFDKADSRLINNLSILSNTPYDSIEAQNKRSSPENFGHVTFKVNNFKQDGDGYDKQAGQENFVELVNVKSNSLSDEFSGTESMEYIHSIENEKAAEKESWYTNLITITQNGSDSTSADFNGKAESPNTSEVHVITGNDTLSAVICLEEGLADDDSWVEELDREDFAIDESSDSEEILFMEREEDTRRFNRCEIDFTLHTIVEESGEESEVESDQIDSTDLEKYFVYEIGGSEGVIQNGGKDLDSVSESSSTMSEGVELPKVAETSSNDKNTSELAPSRLEKYFLSGFMGFNKRDSDGSVGSDSEGKHSPEQRRKKLVRARGTNRHSSLDNLNEELTLGSGSLSENSSSDTDCHEENTFEKNDGHFDTVKRTKKKKRSLVSSIEHLECCETPNENKKTDGGSGEAPDSQKTEATSVSNDLNVAKELSSTKNVDQQPEQSERPRNCLSALPGEGLSRKDSFNNWSSDEETNLMMSKMRTFFKSMIANQRKNASPVVKNRNKPPQLVYFETELTRLMKTVPGLRDDQVKEIVEYLSSEDTWSDSYDSSDYTSSDLEVGTKKSPFQGNISIDCCKVPDIDQVGAKQDTDLVYNCLMSSFQHMEGTAATPDPLASRNSPPLINKVMQHIGSRLVALMHEVSDGSAATPKVGRYHRRLQSKLPTISTTTEDEDDSVEECSPLPRSKSYDPLLEESRQETSDNERFSWRGSFESALMTGSDSRTRLPSTGETSASALALAAAKRRSAGDLLFKSGNNSREHLDRVRSCGSIGGGIEDKIWSMRHARKRRSSVPDGASNSGESADGENDSEDDDDDDVEEKLLSESIAKSTTLPRTLQTSNSSMTNSLPRLSSSVSPTTSIYKVNSSHQFGVKSARYRPPGYGIRGNAGSFATLCAPPRRDYNRRRQNHQQILLPAPTSIAGFGDDCSVSSDISERTGIPDNESEKSHSRISTVSVTRSDSMASVYSGAGEGRYGVVPVRGEVEFGLQYNYKAGDVEIHVKRCSDLAPVDVKRNRSDPYVKVYLLPDKSKSGKRKTKVKKHTLNPIFDEVLKYHVSLEELKSRTLSLSVWHSDMFGRNDFLGEVVIPLENKVFDDPSPKSYPLKERTEVPENVSTFKGELIVALKFVFSSDNKLKKRNVTETGSLHVLIKEAKNLTAVKSNGTSDPFCKSYLLPNKGRSCKQKTPVLKRTCHPVWNHTFVYNNVTLDEMSQRCLELTIWDHDRLASNEFLGGVRLSLGTGLYNDKLVDWMDSNNRETALWQRMLDHPNFWVESSLVLRPSLDVRNKT